MIRSLYSAINQIMETVLANKSSAFRECVLIEYPRKGIWTLALITRTTTGEVQDLRREARVLKEVVADLTLENRLLKKSMIADGGDDE